MNVNDPVTVVMKNQRLKQMNSERTRRFDALCRPGPTIGATKRRGRRPAPTASSFALVRFLLVGLLLLCAGRDGLLHPSLLLIPSWAIPTAVAAFEVARSSWTSSRRRSRCHHHHESAFIRHSSGTATSTLVLHVLTPKDRYTQVITDVDDTLKSSGGVNIGGVALGGIDTQYARGEVYPGVAEFYLHLSLNPATGIAPKVAVLTARAEEFKSLLELKDSSKVAQALTKAGAAANVSDWGLGPVLYGSVAEWIAQDRKGLRKFSNFERLLSQDPSGQLLQYCYVGDTGELDQEAGETMLREYPEVVQAVFLHVVSDKPYPRIPPFKVINGRPVVFFRTYVGAAVAAVQLGLMTVDGLRAVVNAACGRLANVPQSSDKWVDLRKDLERANRILKVV